MNRAGAIASLPMYDFRALESAHDQLWSVLRRYLARAGVAPIPDHLDRQLHHETIWTHPDLLLAQACEYPLAKSGKQSARLVATPRYKVPGCEGATYRSAIVVRADDPAADLADLKGRRCAINDRISNSGMNLLRAALAPIARGQPIFRSVQVSGSHRCSLEAIIGHQADVAAIDCVSLALLTRLEPEIAGRIRILAWTPASPSLPYVTSAAADDATLQRLRRALQALSADPVMDLLRDKLFLEGFDLDPVEGFQQVLQLERIAAEQGYPQLH